MSFSLHSSTVNLGGGRRSGSLASNSSSSRSWPVKSSMGLISRNVSARWTSRNFLNESRCTAIRSGSGRTSSRLAKENRSRATERAGKGLLLRKGAGCADTPRGTNLRESARRSPRRAAAASRHLETRSGRARQPASVGPGGRYSNPPRVETRNGFRQGKEPARRGQGFVFGGRAKAPPPEECDYLSSTSA